MFAVIAKAVQDVSQELQLHNGTLEVVDFKDGVAYLALKGACVGCQSVGCGVISNFEYSLKVLIPQINRVVFLGR